MLYKRQQIQDLKRSLSFLTSLSPIGEMALYGEWSGIRTHDFID